MMMYRNHPSTADKLWLTLFSVAGVAMVTKLFSLVLSVTPTVLFAGAITLTTIYGGIKFGLLGLVVTVLMINYFFTPPLHSLTLAADDLFRFIALAVSLPVAVYLRITSAYKADDKSAGNRDSSNMFLP